MFWATSFGKNYRRRDRDHLVPSRRMDAAVYRTEVCYPFGRKHGRHQAVKRRDFIALIGAAAAWPLAARAQQGGGIRRIGVLMAFAESDREAQSWVTAFREELSKLGWTEGGNIEIDTRWATADVESMQRFAKEFVALRPDFILTSSTPATAAMLQQTRTIPIIFVWVA